MSRELLNTEVGKYKHRLWNNEITDEQVMQEIRDICFVEPKVAEKDFLDVVHLYDKNFAPIPEGEERQKRTAIMKKAQEGMLKHALHERGMDDRELTLPEGQKQIARHHYILLRDGTKEQKQEMLNFLTSGDKKAVGEYIYNRLGTKRDKLFSLLAMSDEQLVENYFEYADDLALISELQLWVNECEYTDEQAKVMQELYENMTRFTCLTHRIDMMANPYYAKYPIESMRVPEDDLVAFDGMMSNLARVAGEQVGNFTTGELHGPTHMLGYDYQGMRTFLAGAAMKQIEDYLAPYGKKYGDVLWANYKGTPINKEWAPTNLMEGKMVFVSIPGGGAKVLYNTATNPQDFKLEDVPNEVINQYMQTISQNARETVAAANPIFLSIFSGSKEFNTMEKCMKEAEMTQKALEGMSYPLDRGDPRVQRAVEAIKNLGKAHEAYMQRKEGQGLQRDDKGNLIGRTKNEVNRLDAADKAENMYKALKFQMEYQLSPESTHGRMQDDAKKLAEKRAAENAKAKNETWRQTSTTKIEVLDPLKDEEKSKSTKQEILEKAVYLTMPACKASDAGQALSKIQGEVVSSINLLAARAGLNKVMSTSVQNDMRAHMAKVALFDYLLRERAAYNPDSTADKLVAGPLEQAMNKGETATMDAFYKLANSEAFKNIIGKVTPARMEAFLNGKESRTQEFDKIVQEGLGLTKPALSAPSTQPAQLQAATNEMQQAGPKAPAPNVPS